MSKSYKDVFNASVLSNRYVAELPKDLLDKRYDESKVFYDDVISTIDGKYSKITVDVKTKWSFLNTCDIILNIRAYNSDRGVCIQCSHSFDSKSNFLILSRGASGSYKKIALKKGVYLEFDNIRSAVDKADTVNGIKKAPIQSNINWITPNPVNEALGESGFLENKRYFHSANFAGTCTINKDLHVIRDAVDPEVEAFFLVAARDYLGRVTFFIFNNDTQFVVAAHRGCVTKIINDEALFAAGDHKIVISNICVDDFNFIYRSVGLTKATTHYQ